MPTHLTTDDHIEALIRRGAVLREAAAAAGFDARVPTCPAWTVAKLVAHQGMVHRWAAANLRGETDPPRAKPTDTADLLAWYSAGLAALVDTIRASPDDAKAMVFLNDAPPPRGFWARRQAHETTIHSVDAISAGLGRWPSATDVAIDSALAADGIDELLCGFITRGKGKLHSAEPYAMAVKTADTGHAWTVRISDGPIVATPGETERPEVTFSGTAVQLYLSLWNRADEMAVDGSPDVVDHWRSQIRIRWS
jgi:uncharacterized protein (TIGR03083 family)